MALAFNLLIFLIAAAPVLAFIGVPVALPLLIALIACAIAAITLTSRQADAGHLTSATRGLLWIIALPLLLVLVQLVPLPLSLSHPIWPSAAEALPARPFGHITIDIGRTASTFISILALIAVGATSVMVARDRRRAELLLLTSGAIASVMSLASIVQNVIPTTSGLMIPRATALTFAGIGVLLNCAVILLAFERRETRGKEAAHYLPIGLGSIFAILINAAELCSLANVSQSIAVGLGLFVLVLLIVIRRLNLSAWTIAGLCAAALAGMGILAAWLFGANPAATGLLRFVPAAEADAIGVLQHLMADSRWFGSGAGTVDLLARIYQTGAPSAPLIAPSTAIRISAEFGWIGLFVFAVVGLGLFFKLFNGALERGRDWFFPAVAAACVIGSMASSFIAPGVLQLPAALILAVIIGVGLSQGFSQSARS